MIQFRMQSNDRVLSIGVVTKSQYFGEYAVGISEAINNFGFSSTIHENIKDAKEEYVIVIDPLLFEKELSDIDFKNQSFFAIQTEQIPTPNVWSRNFSLPRLKQIERAYKYFDVWFEWSRESYRFLSKKFPNFRFFYHSTYDKILEPTFKDTINKSEYDIVFIGDPVGMKNRRGLLLSTLEKSFAVYPKYKGIWEQEKREVLKNTRIALNIHFDDGFTFENPRIYEYLSAGKFVLSEHIFDSYPFVAGKHFGEFYLHNVEKVTKYYLENPKLMQKIAKAGYNAVKKYHLNTTIKQILDHVILESYKRTSRKYRLRDQAFHITGIQKFKEVA